MSTQSTACSAPSPPQDALARLQILACRTLRRYVQHFRLTETENGLILQGQVHTYYAKQCAQQAVMALTEIPIAVNQIDVVEPEPFVRDSLESSFPDLS